jgi:hypothetical protein
VRGVMTDSMAVFVEPFDCLNLPVYSAKECSRFHRLAASVNCRGFYVFVGLWMIQFEFVERKRPGESFLGRVTKAPRNVSGDMTSKYTKNWTPESCTTSATRLWRQTAQSAKCIFTLTRLVKSDEYAFAETKCASC